MKAGDRVVYVRDPLLFGVGEVDSVRADGRLWVVWSDGSREVHDAHEFELEAVWREHVL